MSSASAGSGVAQRVCVHVAVRYSTECSIRLDSARCMDEGQRARRRCGSRHQVWRGFGMTARSWRNATTAASLGTKTTRPEWRLGAGVGRSEARASWPRTSRLDNYGRWLGARLGMKVGERVWLLVKDMGCTPAAWDNSKGTQPTANARATKQARDGSGLTKTYVVAWKQASN